MIKQWAVSICATGIAIAVIQMMMPQLKLKNVIDMVLSLFLLIAIASPLIQLSGRDMEIGFTPVDPGVIEQKAYDFTAEAVRMTLRSEIQNIAGQMGIKPRGVRIEIDVTGSVCNIASITVYLPEDCESRHDEISAQMQEALGQVVYISYSEEDIT